MKNIKIAEQLKCEMLKNKELEMSIRSKARGSIKVFLRNNECQKIVFKTLEIKSSTIDSEMWDGIELPANVYRRFCLLLCEVVVDLHEKLDYGHLTCEWNFVNVEDTDEWSNDFTLSFEKETHFSNTPKRSQH